jgi:hypothetical protein
MSTIILIYKLWSIKQYKCSVVIYVDALIRRAKMVLVAVPSLRQRSGRIT